MLDNLRLNNFSLDQKPSFEEFGNHFVLKTCQRTLILSLNDQTPLSAQKTNAKHTLEGVRAYEFLLQIICGLQSKLIGENEIVSQFKAAYQDYAQQENRSTKILLILEKLFKDAKEIRTKYLVGIGQKTYSSIARKHLINKHKADAVLVLGSGQLAEDLINQLKKKTKVYLSARNKEREVYLCQQHGIEAVKWKDFSQYADFAYIANSIGCQSSRFIKEDFFQSWAIQNQNQKLFIDLGAPSVIETNLQYEDGVIRLEDIFKEGAIQESYKQQKIAEAKKAMDGLVAKRDEIFKQRISATKNNT